MTANDNNHRGLLPAGLADLLPPDAAREARAIDVAIERFAAFGYVTKGMDVVRKIQQSPATGQTLKPPIKILRVQSVP